MSNADVEREIKCGICMETDSKVVLQNCRRALCYKCKIVDVLYATNAFEIDIPAITRLVVVLLQKSYNGFGTTGSVHDRKTEFAAFFAQTSHETTEMCCH